MFRKLSTGSGDERVGVGLDVCDPAKVDLDILISEVAGVLGVTAVLSDDRVGSGDCGRSSALLLFSVGG